MPGLSSRPAFWRGTCNGHRVKQGATSFNSKSSSSEMCARDSKKTHLRRNSAGRTRTRGRLPVGSLKKKRAMISRRPFWVTLYDNLHGHLFLDDERDGCNLNTERGWQDHLRGCI
jgi:hypothetical protein